MTFYPPASLIQFNAVSSGIGSFVVASALAGCSTPEQAGATDGKVYSYYAYNIDGTIWEQGKGVYSYSTHSLARTTIQWTSAESISPVNFITAPKVTVFIPPGSFLEQFIGYNLYTSSQTITIPPGSTRALIRMVGSSGGTGGAKFGTFICTCVTTNFRVVSRPSGAGAALRKFLTGLVGSGTLVFTLGAVGAAGASTPTAGGNAGSTTLASGTQTISTLTCPGGNGSGAGNTTDGVAPAATSISTGGDVNLIAATTNVLTDAPDSWGYAPNAANSAGNNIGSQGNGFGAGSSGSVSNSAVVAGVAGILGALEIYWYP